MPTVMRREGSGGGSESGCRHPWRRTRPLRARATRPPQAGNAKPPAGITRVRMRIGRLLWRCRFGI